jgi:hypothetical protein
MLLRKTLFVSIVLFSLSSPASAADTSALLYRIPPPGAAQRPLWDDGHFGPIASFQAALRARLAAAGVPADQLPGVDGKYGPGTHAGIQRLLTLPAFSELAPAPGQKVGITTALWERLLPGTPPPGVPQRIDTLILTYEATPFDSPAEWNFCQSAASALRRTATPCRTNDPKSYLTWGLRGATAGGGREIQGVLIAADTADQSLINSAFGSEATSVRRFLRLGERRTAPVNLDTERYLCAVWLDPVRAERWAAGFSAFGALPEVRRIYFDLYGSADFDGGKVAAFRRLYQELGRQPTEIDLAFFMDRATHTGGVFAAGANTNSAQALAQVAARVRAGVGDPAAVPAWRIRRALSAILATQNQGADRNGRDVVFFVDGVGVGQLSTAERANWLHRGPRFASDLGLSDDRSAPAASTGTTQFPTRAQPFDSLSPAEAAQCSLRILNWVNPNTGPRQPQIQ